MPLRHNCVTMRLAVIGSLVALCVLPAFGQSGSERPRFDIVSVNVSAPAMNPFTFASGGLLRGERYDLRKATMLDLIRIAYKIPAETILGGPSWLEFDRFDIAAKAPAQSSPETVRGMLQALLVERFHLAVHNDMRPMPAYVLSVLKTKPKLTESSASGEPECKYVPQPNGSLVDAYSCRNISMSGFAMRLQDMGRQYLKDPVIDTTGLEGAWDFDIQWTRRSAVLPGGVERTTVFDAIEKQLGLKLELRDAPAPVLVIDRVDKPAPDAPDVARKLPPRPLEFEVATLKLNKSGQHGYTEYTRGGLRATGIPLIPMLGFAWDINTVHTAHRFVGLPKGVESVYFDMDARSADHTNGLATGISGFDDDLRAMLRALLVERFRIKWHYEDRPVEAYSLVSAKPKLRKGDPAGRASCHEARNMANDPRDANPLLTQLVSCRNVTLAQFASKLQEIDDFTFAYPAEDATGIKGTWDFDLSFTPGGMVEQSLGPAKPGGEALEPNAAVSVAQAIGKQLGLRLEKRKRLLPVIVIDHMELTPTEN
jgi:uncharacterized protein (TIGR03435 family)